MTNAPPDVFGLAEKRLAWIDRRQAVLAQNIANANTPSYTARDVKPFREFLAAQASRVSVGGVSMVGSAAPASPDKTLGARSPDGNAVVLDEQLEKVAETDSAHQLAMNLMRKYVGLFKTAIGRN